MVFVSPAAKWWKEASILHHLPASLHSFQQLLNKSRDFRETPYEYSATRNYSTLLLHYFRRRLHQDDALQTSEMGRTLASFKVSAIFLVKSLRNLNFCFGKYFLKRKTTWRHCEIHRMVQKSGHTWQFSNTLSRVYGCVININEFWIGWLDLLTASF
jgi:hypothetical protein